MTKHNLIVFCNVCFVFLLVFDSIYTCDANTRNDNNDKTMPIIIPMNSIIVDHISSTKIKYHTGKIFDVLKGQSLKIGLLIMLLPQSAMRCTGDDHTTLFYTKLKTDNITSVIEIPYITEEMSTKWHCVHDMLGVEVEIIFEVKVKDANAMTVTVQAMEMRFEVADLTELEYDALSEYIFEENEFVTAHCFSDGQKHWRLSIRNYDNSGRLIYGISPRTAITSFYWQINTTYNHAYFDCIKTFENMTQTFTYRTIFKLKNNTSTSDPFLVTINDKEVLPKWKNKSNTDLNYKYFFTGEEELRVSCKKRDKKTSDSLKSQYLRKFTKEADMFSLYTSGNDWKAIITSRSIQIYKITLVSGVLTEGKLKCSLGNSSTEITFLPKSPGKEERFTITVPVDNKTTVRKYKRKNKSSIDQHVDLYQTVDSPPDNSVTSEYQFNITVPVGNYARDKGNIPKNKSSIDQQNDLNQTVDSDRDNTVSENLEDSSVNSLKWIIISAVGVVVTAIVAGCVIVCYRRKNKTVNTNIQNANEAVTPEYEYVTMERPRQLEQLTYDYAYASNSPNFPQPCHNRPIQPTISFSSTSEDPYTEIDEYFINKRKVAQELKRTIRNRT